MVAMVGVVLQGIIQIELPRGERTSVKASGDTTLPELLQVGVNSVFSDYLSSPLPTSPAGLQEEKYGRDRCEI